MKTQLKDVLHLYIGCDVQLAGHDNTVYKLVGVTESEMTDGDKPLIAISKIDDVYHESYIEDIFPTLRLLSDMNEKERTEIEEILGVLNADHFVNAWVHNTPYSISIHNMVQLINVLRKNGFDMDELIESKQAIDKTTLK